MAEEEPQEEQAKEEQAEPNTGILILQQLQHMNRLLGAINQNITNLETLKYDVEMCKVHLGRIRKTGLGDLTIQKEPDAPIRHIPPEL